MQHAAGRAVVLLKSTTHGQLQTFVSAARCRGRFVHIERDRVTVFVVCTQLSKIFCFCPLNRTCTRVVDATARMRDLESYEILSKASTVPNLWTQTV